MTAGREFALHVALVNWLRTNYPAAQFRSDLGGVRLPIGLAAKAASLQRGRGWPDLFLAEPRRGYYGLFGDLKTDRGEVFTKAGELRRSRHVREQATVLEALQARGYWAGFLCGFEEARDRLEWYLNEERP